METIKDYIIGVLKEKGISEMTIREVMQLSDERIQWLKDAARNYANDPWKYKSLSRNMPHADFMVFDTFVNKEHERFIEETERFIEEHREFMREIRQREIEKASSSMIYLFPIGEA